ncbi:MAG: Uma2 family endonuclease [Planctomycetota bacterium]
MATDVLTTADELPEISAAARNRGQRCELIAGELKMMSPGGWKHGRTIGKVELRLARFIEDNELGEWFGAETGFRIAREPDTVRAPDFAFIAKANLPEHDPPEAYWPGAPDFAVEVLSPHDRTGDVDEKIKAWLAAGVRLLWVINPGLQTVTAYRSMTDVSVCVAGEEVEAPGLLPGFRVAVAEFFR